MERADAWSLALVVAAVMLANLLYIAGVFDPNPLGQRSGLLSHVSAGVVNGLPTIDPNTGFVSQALGHRAMLDLLHLHLPWWNPFEGTGAPLAGEMQSAALFPFTLFTLLSNGQLYEHILLELIAGVSTFVLMRRLHVSRPAAVAAAIAFELNGTFAWFAHAPVNPIAFLPLMLLGLEEAYRASVAGRSGGWWLLAVSGALSAYAGFPETAYIDGLLALVWFGWRCGCLRRGAWRRFAFKALVGAIVAALLATPLILASANYLQNGDLGVHGGAVGGLMLPSQGLSMLLLPYVFGPIFDYNDPGGIVFGIWGGVGGYLTTSLLVLGLMGLISRRRRGLKLVLLVWIVLSVARIYEDPAFLGHVLGVLPGMNRVAFYRYAFPSLELSLVVLAAFGLDDLVAARGSWRRVAPATAVALALVAVAINGAVPLAHRLGAGHGLYARLSAGWAVASIVLIAAISLLRSARWRSGLLVALVALDAGALFAAPELSAPRAVKPDLAPVRYLRRHIGLNRVFTLGPLQPNYGSYFGIAELDVNDLPVPKAFARYVHARLDPYTDPLIFVGNDSGGRSGAAPATATELIGNLGSFRDAGVSYVLAPAGQPLPRAGGALALVLRSPSTWIYRLRGASSFYSTGSPRCRVSPRGFAAVRVSCAGPTTLVRRETYFAGWSAKIDGRPARLRSADGPFQAVSVGGGSHLVTFSYAPPGEGFGLAAFLLGLAALAAGPGASRRRWRGRSRRSGPARGGASSAS